MKNLEQNKIRFVLLIYLFSFNFLFAQTKEEKVLVQKEIMRKESKSSIEKTKKRKTFFSGKTDLSDPFRLRDPFKSPLKKKKKKKRSVSQATGGGVFTNLNTIDTLKLENLKIVGVLVGKERRALAKIDKDTIVLKEGMLIGSDGAVLKAIVPGGVILVEKIINVYGEEEYLETVIPINEEK